MQFDHFFRRYPDYGAHQAGYCINAGLEWLLDWMQRAHFRDEDIDYLRGQTGRSGKRGLCQRFPGLAAQERRIRGLTMRAIPEGRVVHPNVPLTVVQGPLAMAQILETSLLNHLNYQTLIATKAARIHESGRAASDAGVRAAPGAREGSQCRRAGGPHRWSRF